MPRLRVVFDTNVYRGLSTSRFSCIQRIERSRSVQAVASPWVALELLAHMAKPEDPDFAPSAAALKRLAEHCRTYNGSQYVLPFLGDVYRQIAYSLLHLGVEHDASDSWLASFVGAVASPHNDGSDDIQAWQEIANRVQEVEVNFERNIWMNVLLASVPSASRWSALVESAPLLREVLADLNSEQTLRLLAEQVLERARQMGSTKAVDPKNSLDLILSACSKPLRFELALLSQVIAGGLDLTKPRHRNTVWDIHIAVATTMFAALSRDRIWLVTDDRLVHRAALAASVADSVLPFDKYEAILIADSV